MNVAQLRLDTPGVLDHIHLNNAGSSLPPRPVVERVISHLRLEEKLGGYEAADVVAQEVESFYEEASHLINAASPLEIAFTQSATDSFYRVFSSISLGKKDRVIIFQNEYASILLTLLHQQKMHGFTLDIIPLNAQGNIDLSLLTQKMDNDVKMVLLGHMPTQSGALSPAEEIGRIVKAYNAIYIVDATQTIGQYPCDVEKIGCDALFATGRKFLRGPRGCGFLYIKASLIEALNPPLIDLESANLLGAKSYKLAPGCRRFESFEKSLALMLGMKEAIAYARRIGMENIWQRGQVLSQRMREGLNALDGITLRDPGQALGNIVTFTKEGASCHSVVQALAKQKVAINMSKKLYAWLDFEQRHIDEVCRASPHYYNTEDEIDQFLHAVNQR